MQKLHHFLIHDHDSETNFMLSELPVKFACGYSFCDQDEPSTRSENSQNSDNIIKKNLLHNRTSHTQDDMKGMSHYSDKKPYQQSAIRKHIDNMEDAYADHKIDVAAYEANKVKKLCENSSHKLSAEQKKLLVSIQTEMRDVENYQKILRQDGWQLKIEKKNIKVSSKIEGNTVGVLVEAFLDAPIQNFLATITEIDLMKKWMPFMESSSLEKIISRNCRIGHCVNNFPILAKRESFFQGIGYDRMQHNSTVFMYTRSLNERLDLQKQLEYKVKQTEGSVQLDYRYLILQYKPDTQETGILKMAINVDMKLNIPMFILNPATTGFGMDFYKNVLEIAKNFKNSEWEKKVQANPAFFNFVKRRITEYFSHKK